MSDNNLNRPPGSGRSRRRSTLARTRWLLWRTACSTTPPSTAPSPASVGTPAHQRWLRARPTWSTSTTTSASGGRAATARSATRQPSSPPRQALLRPMALVQAAMHQRRRVRSGRSALGSPSSAAPTLSLVSATATTLRSPTCCRVRPPLLLTLEMPSGAFTTQFQDSAKSLIVFLFRICGMIFNIISTATIAQGSVCSFTVPFKVIMGYIDAYSTLEIYLKVSNRTILLKICSKQTLS